MGLTPNDFQELAAEVARLNGVTMETGLALIAKLGDTPIVDESRRVMVLWPGEQTPRVVVWPED